MPKIKLMRPIALIGMMGAGKSTIAQRLAERLIVPFADTDAAIEASTGRSISDIFTKDGEAKFRAIEAKITASILTSGIGVFALGGGALINEKTRALAAEKTATIWLKAKPETLLARTRSDPNMRPLLEDGDKYAILKQLLNQREHAYAKASIIINAEQSPEQIIENIIKILRVKKILQP